MTDKDWVIAAKQLSKGIRAMPVVRDYPQWWFMLTCDGFGSHVNVPEALQVFTDHKIMLAKEEGDSSHVSQSYDQSVAKCDKLETRCLLDMVRTYVSSVIDQYVLVVTLCQALNKVCKTDAWEASFKKVNLHPHYRVSFEEWQKSISRHINTGDAYFKERENSTFDAMPAVWKKLDPRRRRLIIEYIDRTKEDPNCHSLWTPQSLKYLVKFVPMKQLNNICISYYFAKENPEVINYGETDDDDGSDIDAQGNDDDYIDGDGGFDGNDDVDSEDKDGENNEDEGEALSHANNVSTSTHLAQSDLSTFTLFPTNIMSNYNKNKSADGGGQALLDHMTNFIKRDHWNGKK